MMHSLPTGDYDAVILHYYYTARELGSAYDQLEKVKYLGKILSCT